MGTGQAYAKSICSARTRGETANDIDAKGQRREKVYLVGKKKAAAQHICCGGEYTLAQC